VLLYIATANVLPEAHAAHPARATVLLTVLGAGLMWLVVALGS
jgi:ZIP family zinc transporter